MSNIQRSDVWADGAAYEPFVGRWSRLVAREFLDWLGVKLGSRWLDLGCGTGALTQTILANAEPQAVNGLDRSEEYVAYAKGHVNDRHARATFEVADAQSLDKLETATFDAAVSGLVLNFVPRPELAVGEMARVVKAGGVVAAYVWDYGGKMELIRRFWDTAVALNPAIREKDGGVRFPICQPEPLAKLFGSANLRNVETRAIDVPTVFPDFNDYWSPFLGGQGPAPGYCMSLNEPDRAVLREKIRAALPIEADGSIHLIARAWAVRGRRA